MEIRNTQNRNIKKYMLLTLMLGGINVFGMDREAHFQLSRSRKNLEKEEKAKKKENAGINVFGMDREAHFQLSRSRTNLENEENEKKKENAGINVSEMYEEEPFQLEEPSQLLRKNQEEPSQLSRFKDKNDIEDHQLSRTNLENEENEKKKENAGINVSEMYEEEPFQLEEPSQLLRKNQEELSQLLRKNQEEPSQLSRFKDKNDIEDHQLSRTNLENEENEKKKENAGINVFGMDREAHFQLSRSRKNLEKEEKAKKKENAEINVFARYEEEPSQLLRKNQEEPSQLSRFKDKNDIEDHQLSRTNLENEENEKKKENAGINVSEMYEEEPFQLEEPSQLLRKNQEEPSQLLRFKDKKDIEDHQLSGINHKLSRSRTNLEKEENEKEKQDQFSLYMLQTAKFLEFWSKELQFYMKNLDSSKTNYMNSNSILEIIHNFLQENNSNINFIMDNIEKIITNIDNNYNKDNNKLYLRYLDDNTTCFHNLSELYIEILLTIKQKLSKNLKSKRETDIHSIRQLQALKGMILTILEYYSIVKKIIKDHYANDTIVNEFENISDKIISDKIHNLSVTYNAFNAFITIIENDPKNIQRTDALQSNCVNVLKEQWQEKKTKIIYNNYKNIDEKAFDEWEIFFLELRKNIIEENNNIILKFTKTKNAIISKQKKELKKELKDFQASKIKDRKENTEQQQMELEIHSTKKDRKENTEQQQMELEIHSTKKDKDELFTSEFIKIQIFVGIWQLEIEFLNEVNEGSCYDVSSSIQARIDDFLNKEKKDENNTEFFIDNILRIFGNAEVSSKQINKQDMNNYEKILHFHKISDKLFELYISILPIISEDLSKKEQKKLESQQQMDKEKILITLKNLYVYFKIYYETIIPILCNNPDTIIKICEKKEKLDNNFNEFWQLVIENRKNYDSIKNIQTRHELLKYALEVITEKIETISKSIQNKKNEMTDVNKVLYQWKKDFWTKIKNYIINELSPLIAQIKDNDLTSNVQTLQQELNKKNAEISTLKEQNQLNFQQFQKELKKLKSEITELVKNHTEELKILEEKYQQIIQSLKAEYKEELKSLKEEYQAELARSKESNKEIEQNYYTEIHNITSILQKNSEKNRLLMQQSQKEVEEKFNQENDKFRQKIEHLEEIINTLKIEKQEIENLKEKYEKKIYDLNEKYEEELRKSINKQKEAIKKYCDESIERQNVEKQLKELENIYKKLKQDFDQKSEETEKATSEMLRLKIMNSNMSKEKKLILEIQEEQKQKIKLLEERLKQKETYLFELKERLNEVEEAMINLQKALQASEEKKKKLEEFIIPEKTFEDIEKSNKIIYEFEDIEKLEEKIKALEIEKEAYEKERQAFEKERQAFEKERQAYEKERQAFEKERQAFEKERQDLKAKIKELENNRQQDAITINKNEQEINNLQKALKNTKKERDSYEQDINNAKVALAKEKEKNKNNTREERLKKQEEPSEIEGYAYGEEIDEDDIPKGKKGRKKHQYTNTKQEKEEKEEEKREKREKREKEEEKREFKKRS